MLIVLLCDQKYQKSFKRIFHPLKNLPPRARVSRASHAWQVRAAQGKAKTDSLTALRNFNYTTRANISHEIAEQIRARIVSTPARKMGGAGVGLVCALTEWSYIFLFWLLTTLGFYLVGLRRMADGAWRGGKICRKAAEHIDSIHKMHHT